MIPRLLADPGSHRPNGNSSPVAPLPSWPALLRSPLRQGRRRGPEFFPESEPQNLPPPLLQHGHAPPAISFFCPIQGKSSPAPGRLFGFTSLGPVRERRRGRRRCGHHLAWRRRSCSASRAFRIPGFALRSGGTRFPVCAARPPPPASLRPAGGASCSRRSPGVSRPRAAASSSLPADYSSDYSG